jgi:hypothetical protein
VVGSYFFKTPRPITGKEPHPEIAPVAVAVNDNDNVNEDAAGL